MRGGEYSRTTGVDLVEIGAGTTIPRFFVDTVPDELATAAAGRPIGKEVERVQILLPANRYLAPVHNVTDEHRQRWPREYEAFKKGIEIAADGTPLEQWNILTKSQVYELKGIHLRTVEDVARMPDSAMQQLPFGQRLREAAAAYLDDAASSALSTRLNAENDRMQSDMVGLKRENEELKAQMNQMWAELQGMRNAPNPLLSRVPSADDPFEQMKQGQPAPSNSGSSFDNFAMPKRRGRPPRQPDPIVDGEAA